MEQLKQRKRSKIQETGHRLFEFTRKQSSSSSPTERKNLKIMRSKLPLSSRLSPRSITQTLSTMIRQSEPTLEMCGTSSSWTSLSSRISDSTGFTHLDRGSEIQTLGAHLIAAQGQAIDQMTTVLGSTTGNALIRPPAANTDIGVQAAEVDTRRRTAIREETELRCQRPHYTRRLLWGAHDLSGHGDISDTARWGLTASPVPGVPLKEFENLEAIQTIEMNPDLFQVNCSLNIDRFRELLVNHPNQALIDSVCQSLHEGYWPYADTKFGDIKAGYPTTLDMSSKGSTSNEHLDFIWEQVKVEVAAGRYSASFGPKLLPGMYSSPVHAVPKPPDTLQLINHQSYGDHSLNSMILREDVAGTCMDGIRSLGTALLRFWEEYGDDVELVIYKSDISHAYWNFWVHPLWQIKQIVSVGAEQYVDRCNCFGGRASYLLFLSFSLLAWIAQEVKLIKNLRTYIDDNGSFAHVGDVTYYPLYDSYYPSDQVKLLLLWDKLNIPHAKKKQVYGLIIPYVGFDVNPNAMTISLSDDCRSELIAKVHDFSRIGKHRSLLEYQQLAGHINWSLPVWPLLCPCLSGIYAKIAGKTKSFAGI